MLDSKADRAVAEAAKQFQAMFGSRLASLALYGSAAGVDYVPGASDINLVAVLEDLGYDDLVAVRAHVARWRKQRITTPLLIDRRFVSNAVDVFPMELHDIQAQHRILAGEDIFAALTINDTHLRYQCEHEARGKVLRLRELFLEIGTNRRQMRGVILDSLKTFLIIMRNLSRMRGGREAASYDQVLPTFGELFQHEFPVMSHLLQIKLSRVKWDGNEDAVFRDYLAELHSLVRLIDELPLDTDADQASQPS